MVKSTSLHQSLFLDIISDLFYLKLDLYESIVWQKDRVLLIGTNLPVSTVNIRKYRAKKHDTK
jgi:hypothetical protein